MVVARPDLVASVTFGAGVCVPDYFWHVQARIWQTTGLGEQSRDRLLEMDVPARSEVLQAAGMPAEHAPQAAAALDRRMFDHILPLYRSEPFLGDWAFDPAATYPPALVLWGRDDPYQPADVGRAAAGVVRARYVELDCGHWWQLERPDQAAAELAAHWAASTRTAAASERAAS